MRKYLSLLAFLSLALALPVVCSAQGQGPQSFTLSALNQCATINTDPKSTSGVYVDVSGTFSATLQPEASVAGSSYKNVAVTPTTSQTQQSTITTTGGYNAAVAGPDHFQVCVSAYTSGSAVVVLSPTTGVASNAIGGGGGGGGSLPSGTLCLQLTNTNGGTGYATSGTAGCDTTVNTGSDRCAEIKATWTSYGMAYPINAIGEQKNAATHGAITCSSNPFPVTSSYGGTDPENGGAFWLPDGVFPITSSVGLAIGNVQIHGASNGFSTGGNYGGTTFAVNGSFASGAGVSFNPAAFFMGCPLGQTGTGGACTSTTGPFGTTVEHIWINAAGVLDQAGHAVVGVSYCGGQELTGFRDLHVMNSLATGLMVGCGENYNVDGGVVRDVLINKLTSGTSWANTTLANISAWTLTHLSGNVSVVVVTWNNSPTAAPGCGENILVSGAANGGTHSTNINGTYIVAAVSDSSNDVDICNAQAAGVTFSSGATQVAFLYKSSVGDSSSTVQGTMGFYSSGVDIDEIGKNRSDFNLTAVSNITDYNNGAYARCGANISGDAITVNGEHLEEAYDGACFGLEPAQSGGASINIEYSMSSPQTNIGNCAIHLFSNWGAVENFESIEPFTTGLVSPGTYNICDDFNSNKLTNANNPNVEYRTGTSGTVGDVIVWGAADCAEMTNGWCQQGNTLAYYSSGTAVIKLNATSGGTFQNLTLNGSGCGAGTYAKADGTGCGTPSGGPGTGTQYTHPYWATTSTLGSVAPTTGYDGVPQVETNSTTSGAFTAAPVSAPQGVAFDAQSGASPTVALTDRMKAFQTTNNTTSTAVTVPAPSATGFGLNFTFLHLNTGSVVATDTPTTATVNGNATLALVGKVSGHNPEAALWWEDATTNCSSGPCYWAAEILPTDANGRLAAEGFGALTGDVTNTAGSYATTVGKINGTAFSGTNGDAVKFGSGNTPADSGLAMPTAAGSATVTQTIASGTATLGTSAISSGACATVVTVSATGVATTDAITWTPNASIKAVTGYAPSTSGGLSIAAYPTSGNVNFDVCNWSSGSITPGSVTLNWRVVR